MSTLKPNIHANAKHIYKVPHSKKLARLLEIQWVMGMKAKCGDRCSKLKSEPHILVHEENLGSIGFGNEKSDKALVKHEVYVDPGVCRGYHN